MDQKSAKVRDGALDAIKGLLIILVILAHNNAAHPMVLETCHPMLMAVFFMASGFLFSTKRGLVKKMRGIIFPFIFFCAVSILWRYLYSFIIHKPLTWELWAEQLLRGDDWGLNIPMWFLLSLAQIIMIIMLMQQLVSRRWLRFTLAITGLLVGLELQRNGIDILYIPRSLTYVPFFMIGMELKAVPEKFPDGRHPMISMSAILTIVLGRACLEIDNLYLKWAIDSVLALALGYLLYNLFKWKYFPSKAFEYYGRNSLVVLCMHLLILDVVWRLWWAYAGSPDRIDAIFQTIIVALLLIPLCELYDKYLSKRLK